MLCANHIAVRDVLLIWSTCHREIKFIAKKELFSVPIVGSAIKALGAVKLDRGGSDVAAMRKSVDLLGGGDIVAIFPQGHRYPAVDPSTTPIKSGAGMIAYRSGCDVIPVFIKTKGNKYGFFKKTELFYGAPIKNSSLGFTHGGKDEYDAAANMIFDEILKLGGYTRATGEGDNVEN